MANERKIFPTEKVLELVAAKKDADVNEVASHILGRTLPDKESAAAAAPFASAWLAKWYPKFMDLEWQDEDDWQAFITRAKATLGDNLSIQTMQGRLKSLAGQALDSIKTAKENLLRQTEAAANLEQKVRELEPLQNAARLLQKKNDELEDKLKSIKSEMATLNRKVQEFQGKLPIDSGELMQTIKDAIKDGLKGATIGAAASVAAPAADNAPEEAQTASTGGDDFGFGHNTDSDGFGF